MIMYRPIWQLEIGCLFHWILKHCIQIFLGYALFFIVKNHTSACLIVNGIFVLKWDARFDFLLHFLWFYICWLFLKQGQLEQICLGTSQLTCQDVEFTQSPALLSGDQNVSLCYYVASWTYWWKEMHLFET